MPFLPFIPFADCIDVFWDFIAQGVPWAVTMLIKSNVAVTPTTLDNLEAILDSWWTTDMAANVSAGCTLRGIKLTDMTSQTGPTRTYSPTTSTGTEAGTVLPQQAAIVVSLATANRGRSYRGRNYWSGRIASDQSTVTQWDGVRLASIDVAYINLKASLLAGGFELGVGSRYNNGVRRTTGVFTPVVGATAKAPIATQRRRLL